MEKICCKCKKEPATVECSACEKMVCSDQKLTMVMCSDCSAVIHDLLKPEIANEHHVLPLQSSDPRSKLESLQRAKSEWKHSQTVMVDDLIQQVASDCKQLQDTFGVALSSFRELLDAREAAFISAVSSTRDFKISTLHEYKETILEDGLDQEKMSELESLLNQDNSEDPKTKIDLKLAEIQQELNSLMCSTPHLPGGSSCGFAPELAPLTLASACLITEHCKEVAIGQKVSVSVIGGVNLEGLFWVRVLPSQHGAQDVVLQNISNSLQIQFDSSFVPLSSPRPGACCAARYYQDQRWYRGRIVGTIKHGKVSVFFMDYGNTEELPISSLAPLDDKFLVFPQQMLRCCFTAEKITINREAKWKFTDLTQVHSLSAELIQRLPGSIEDGGVIHHVKLMDESGAQPFDIGATITVLASVSGQAKSAIKYRDVRYKDQPLPPNARQTITGGGQPTQPTLPTQPSQSDTTNTTPIPTSQIPTPPEAPQPEVVADPGIETSATNHSEKQNDITEQRSVGSENEKEDEGSLTVTLTEDPVGEQNDRSTQSEDHILAEPVERTPTPEAHMLVIKATPSKQDESHNEAAFNEPITEDQPLSEDAFNNQPTNFSSNQPISEPESIPDIKPPGVEPDRNGIATSTQDIVHDGINTSTDTDSEQSSKVKETTVPDSGQSSKVKETTETDCGQSSKVKETTVTGSGQRLKVKETSDTDGRQSLMVNVTGDITAEDTSKVVIPEDTETNEPNKLLPLTELRTKPHALVKPLHFSDGKSDSNDSIPMLNGNPESDIDGGCDVAAEIPDNNLKKSPLCLMNPSVKPGVHLNLQVTTDLSSEGTFWAHLESTSPHNNMFKQLEQKTSELKEMYTPVFFGSGDVCAALFSEDECWYRAEIEAFAKGKFTVRYLDFGNQETRLLPQLAPLKPEFALLPGLAFKCSIACEDHLSFTQPEIDKFDEIVPDDKVSAKVLEVKGDIVYVQLLLNLRSGKSVDLNEEIYLADLSREIETMSFSLGRKKQSKKANPKLPAMTISDTSMTVSWADQMDDIASPIADGLTLAGFQSDRSKTPSPTPQSHRPTPSHPHKHTPTQTGASEPTKPIQILKRPNTSGVRASTCSPFSSPAGSPREWSRSPKSSQTGLTTSKFETTSRERSSSPFTSKSTEAVSRERSSSPLTSNTSTSKSTEAVSRERSSSPLTSKSTEAVSRERSSSPFTSNTSTSKSTEAVSRERSSSPLTTVSGTKPVSRPSHQEGSSRTPLPQGKTSNPTRNAHSRSAPRLNMSVARQSIYSSLNRGGRGGRRTTREQDSGKAERESSADYGHQLVSGTLGEDWDTPKQQLPPTSNLTEPGHVPTQSDSVSTHTHVPPQTNAPTQTHTPPQTNAPTQTHVPPQTHAPTQTHAPPQTNAPTQTHVSPQTNAPTQTHASPQTNAPTRTHAPPQTNAPTQTHGRLQTQSHMNHRPGEDTICLFVKNIPQGKPASYLEKLFSPYGVLKIEHDQLRRHVCYVYLSVGGAQKAIDSLHGKSVDKNTKPLFIEISNHSGRPKPR